MEKKKILKIVGIILLIVVILLIIHTIRNYIIITKLQNNILPYAQSENYHMKWNVTNETGQLIKMNYYEKGNKQAVFMEKEIQSEVYKIAMYHNGSTTNQFYENTKGKVAELNTNLTIAVELIKPLETYSTWQTFIGSITSRVKKIEYNGKECYLIKGFLSPLFLADDERNEMIIESSTGLILKNLTGNTVIQREYEFDNVKDEIFKEPDVTQYEMQ